MRNPTQSEIVLRARAANAALNRRRIIQGAEDAEAPSAFVCYSRSDSIFAWIVSIVLSSLGYSVVYDRSYLRAGEPWKEQLEEAINDSALFVVIWSKRAARSSAVQAEIACARERLMPTEARPFIFLPVPVDGTPPPDSFEPWHFPTPPSTWFG